MSKILPIKEIAKAIGSIPGIFKHTATGKFSARRSISGVLVIAATADIAAKEDISTNALILSFIAVLPLIALSFNRGE
tara:strand:+ start:2532 stop:2765 length:234 start_codon:yes stop_codon:yes gene_type:complete